MAGRRSNCLIFALWLWITRGGYLIVRRSHFGLFPHFLWAPALPPRMRLLHYTTETKDSQCALVFQGKVLRRDSAAGKPGEQYDTCTKRDT